MEEEKKRKKEEEERIRREKILQNEVPDVAKRLTRAAEDRAKAVCFYFSHSCSHLSGERSHRKKISRRRRRKAKAAEKGTKTQGNDGISEETH